MQAENRVQNVIAVAQWYGIAKLCPAKHPQGLDDISAYTERYGVTPDGPASAPWCYQPDPANITPSSWTAPLIVPVGAFYDPRTNQIYLYGVQPANDLDPTSPTFVEPPRLS
jgi:hypothetical protein